MDEDVSIDSSGGAQPESTKHDQLQATPAEVVPSLVELKSEAPVQIEATAAEAVSSSMERFRRRRDIYEYGRIYIYIYEQPE